MKSNYMTVIFLAGIVLILIFWGIKGMNRPAVDSGILDAGLSFLEENAKNPNVKTLPSGLQYEIIKDTEGPKPTLSSNLVVHYHGTLLDGSVFDSSVDREQPASFPLNAVIKGWQEGIQLMSVGSKYKFYIPSKLAYGNASVGKIPGGSVLVFEVELLDFR